MLQHHKTDEKSNTKRKKLKSSKNHSCSSTTVSPAENEGVDPGNESSTDSKGDGSRSEPEVELTPEE